MSSKESKRPLRSKLFVARGAAVVLMLAICLAVPMHVAAQQVADFGIVDFTMDQKVVLSFANIDTSGIAAAPVPVELIFQDGDANTLLSQEYTVEPGQTVSLTLTNEELSPFENQRVPIRALAKSPLNSRARGIASMEMQIGDASVGCSSCSRRFMRSRLIDWSARVNLADFRGSFLQPVINGPISLEPSWTARLSLSNISFRGMVPDSVQAKLSFVDATGKTLKEKTVTLSYQQWATLDLSGKEFSFTNPILVRVDYLAPTRVIPSINLELFDTATGITVGSSSSPGGGGGGMS